MKKRLCVKKMLKKLIFIWKLMKKMYICKKSVLLRLCFHSVFMGGAVGW